MPNAINQDGLPIFDQLGRLLSNNNNNDVTDVDGNIVPINQNGDPIDEHGQVIGQPPIGVRVQALIVAMHVNVNQAGQAPVMQVPRQPPVGYGRTPARANGTNTFDYTTREGQSIFRDNTKSLYRDNEDCFNLSSTKLNGFMSKVEHRANNAGWTIMNVDVGEGHFRNIATQYGEVTMDHVWEYVHTYDSAFNRADQDDAQLFACLIASTTTGAQETLALKENLYTTATGEKSGLLYLKLIIQESTIETKSTMNSLWTKITAGMPSMMEERGNNILKFNDDVRSVQKQLRARGENPEHLIPQLLSVYANCEDEDTPFHRYIETVENNYNEGTLELTTDTLMHKADQKYKDLIEKDMFRGSTKKDEAIVALTTKMEELMDTCDKLKSSGGSNHKSNNGSSNKYRKPPAWVYQEPNNGDPKSKTVEGKTYHWCPGNGAHKPRWVTHLPEKCNGLKNGSTEEKDAKTDSKATKKGEKEPVKWTTMMKATIEEEDIDG
ncbi:unknown protein [Seminavis robusta]|uniref:Uncharacterized protein n=1 Tax=Seminavis robusta TaxID=568900 RepID=A0A9N8HSQ5_9STRA|nr:unknown protein [Seminavis robusta]|eukprot:Sro1759_g295780.1 n/a (494) ;mRNA; r:2760-4241